MTHGGREEFDRIKPPERRLLERPAGPRLDDEAADPDGRAALFSAGAGSTGGHRDTRGGDRDAHGGREASAHREGVRQDSDSGLAVHCSRCEETSTLDAGTALRTALPLFVVLPWREHPVFAMCPACRHRAWLRIGSS